MENGRDRESERGCRGERRVPHEGHLRSLYVENRVELMIIIAASFQYVED